MKIKKLTSKYHLQIIDVWKRSVEATHDFLKKEDIEFYRPIVFQYIKEMNSYGLVDDGGTLYGFIAFNEENIEMLFLAPEIIGKGYGRKLVEWTISKFGLRYVTVNEQNESALAFYKKMGFVTESRSEYDSFGKPYPLLNMCLPQNVEVHPLGFFLPKNSHLLMLGSFPPPRQRWSMNFYYPNILNDMWRILGLIFYSDKDYFLDSPKAYSEEKAKAFCMEKGISIGDTGVEVVRLQGNASDKFLKIVKPIDIKQVLESIPECRAIVVTGEKAMETLLSVLPPVREPEVGSYSEFRFMERDMRLYRMPSSSRAYPKPLEEKAAIYKPMFEDLGMI